MSKCSSLPSRLLPKLTIICPEGLTNLAAGRVGRAAGFGADVRKRQPKKLLCAPGLTVFDPEQGASDALTALAVVCATWLEDVGITDFQALRLAPPVLEAWAPAGRLISRAVVDFGLEWSLPAADGIERRPHRV